MANSPNAPSGTPTTRLPIVTGSPSIWWRGSGRRPGSRQFAGKAEPSMRFAAVDEAASRRCRPAGASGR